MTYWAIQSMDEFQTKKGAGAALDALRMQDGFLGGRLLPARYDGDSTRVQAFFEDEPEADGLLPEGMERVVVPRVLQTLLELPEQSDKEEDVSTLLSTRPSTARRVKTPKGPAIVCGEPKPDESTPEETHGAFPRISHRVVEVLFLGGLGGYLLAQALEWAIAR